jgi:membrane protease YdiL (CAAX protease family)
VISLLAPPLILLLAVTALYGLAPLRALGQSWSLIFVSFLPALAITIVFNNVVEEIGWTGSTFARLQDRRGPLRAALLTTVFFWLFRLAGAIIAIATRGRPGLKPVSEARDEG